MPARPGLYAVTLTHRALGLPRHIDIAYVGKSLNLQRRFQDHLAEREPNAGLYGLMRRSEPHNLEFWYTRARPEALGELEKTLIRQLRPRINRRLYER